MPDHPNTSTGLTTAEALGQLHRELLAQGFDREQAFDLVELYAGAEASEGYGVHAVTA